MLHLVGLKLKLYHKLMIRIENCEVCGLRQKLRPKSWRNMVKNWWDKLVISKGNHPVESAVDCVQNWSNALVKKINFGKFFFNYFVTTTDIFQACGLTKWFWKCVWIDHKQKANKRLKKVNDRITSLRYSSKKLGVQSKEFMVPTLTKGIRIKTINIWKILNREMEQGRI